MRKINLGAVHKVKQIFMVLVLGLSFSLSAQEADPIAGKKLFNANCAACHKLNKKAVGPALKGVSAKYDKEWLYSWIKNSSAMIKAGDAQAVAIWEEYNKTAMTAFPQLSDQDIDNIIAYTDYTPPAPAATAAGPVAAAPAGDSISNDIILGAFALVFAILVVMLILVNRTLKKIAAAQGIELEPKAEEKKHAFHFGKLCTKPVLGHPLCGVLVAIKCLLCLWILYASRALIKVTCLFSQFTTRTKFTRVPTKLSVNTVTLRRVCPNIQEFLL